MHNAMKICNLWQMLSYEKKVTSTMIHLFQQIYNIWMIELSSIHAHLNAYEGNEDWWRSTCSIGWKHAMVYQLLAKILVLIRWGGKKNNPIFGFKKLNIFCAKIKSHIQWKWISNMKKHCTSFHSYNLCLCPIVHFIWGCWVTVLGNVVRKS